MNNISNQLNIKNLLKTKLAEQLFNKEQLIQIRLGLKNNVDVSVYANPKFNANQMDEIRLGLKEKLNVSIYADPKYDWQKMEEIRFKLENELKEKQKYELDFLLN